MPFKRTVSMPEASDLLPPRFPIRNLDTKDLDPLHEHEEYSGEPKNSKMAGCEKDKNSTVKISYAENDTTEDTVEDDYGFFPMDDDIQNGDSLDERDSMPEDAASTSNSDSSSDQLGSSYGSSSMTRRVPRKSSLKRGSAYGVEGIPLDFERKEFNRVLPKPDLSQRVNVSPERIPKGLIRSGSRGLFRVSSEPVMVRPVYQSDDEGDTLPNEPDQVAKSVPSSEFVEGAMKKRISFGTIQIREHAQTIGDNPSCSYGTPVQLDWHHQDMEELKVDEYENFRPKIRTKEEFHLNHFQRVNLLKLNGHSTNEIKDSRKQTSKVRNQRERTKFLMMNYPQLLTVNEAIESGVRKVKRTISKSKSNSKDEAGTIPKRSSKDDLAVFTSELNKSLILEMMDNDESNATAPF